MTFNKQGRVSPIVLSFSVFSNTWKVYLTKALYFSTGVSQMFPKPSLQSSPKTRPQMHTLKGWIHVDPLIFVIHIGLSMWEMSMMGMSQIGVQVIIFRKNINKKYYATQKKGGGAKKSKYEIIGHKLLVPFLNNKGIRPLLMIIYINKSDFRNRSHLKFIPNSIRCTLFANASGTFMAVHRGEPVNLTIPTTHTLRTYMNIIHTSTCTWTWLVSLENVLLISKHEMYPVHGNHCKIWSCMQKL